MSMILKDKITSAVAWKGIELANDPSWIHHLSPAEIDCIDAALAKSRHTGKAFPGIAREDFPLDGMQPLIARLSWKTGAASSSCAAFR